jgi:hypothetical protein
MRWGEIRRISPHHKKKNFSRGQNTGGTPIAPPLLKGLPNGPRAGSALPAVSISNGCLASRTIFGRWA